MPWRRLVLTLSLGSVALAAPLPALAAEESPLYRPVVPERRNGVVLGMSAGVGFAGASGYPNNAKYLGDPAFTDVPVARLTDPAYAAGLRTSIRLDQATQSASLASAPETLSTGTNTTHFSVIDRFGNAVANTYTLNLSYGVGLIAEGTGILLNNELDDFAAAPGVPNSFGLVGYEANEPGPNKRPLSSMTPTIILKNGRPLMVTGSPGGSRIITAVLQVVLNSLDFGMGIDAAVSAPRLHHQWQPDEVRVEPGFDPALLADLAARGHHVVPSRPATSANSIAVTKDGIVGSADPRTRGALAAGY